MAKNDVVLIDSLISKRTEEAGITDIGRIFDIFVIDQILKNQDLSREEVEFGWIDGAHDGGIDAFYTFVNGRLLTDPDDFQWPKSRAEIEVFIITCKHNNTFSQAPLDSVFASIQEIFDLSKHNSGLYGKYSKELLRCRGMFIAAYDRLSLNQPAVTFRVIYASRGDTSMLGGSVVARSAQITKLLESYFSASIANFTWLGAAELVDLHRKTKEFSLDLPVQKCLTAGREGYVVLARLSDYCKFVRDEDGNLRRYLFDSNVRAFLGENAVNKDICDTLNDLSAPNFWWLNNGVTILATSASLVGDTLKLKDIQIVNGLQTTESIHKHFQPAIDDVSETRAILIKVIISADEKMRDQVIRATNSQTAVEASALHATDRIQQDIEEILLKNDWYYERRTNYFRNEGRPDYRILVPLELATGSVAVLLKNPLAASKLKQKHIRSPEAYGLVYSDRFPLQVWPLVAALIRGADSAILRSDLRTKKTRTRLSTWRGVLAYVTAVRLTGTFSYTLNDLCRIDTVLANDALIDDCWTTLAGLADKFGGGKLSSSKMLTITNEVRKAWGIAGNADDGRTPLPSMGSKPRSAHRAAPEAEEFLTAVKKALPPQPWQPGVHRVVASKLETQPQRVSNAIQILIARGAVFQQIDGVVYDAGGKEIMRDPTRTLAGT